MHLPLPSFPSLTILSILLLPLTSAAIQQPPLSTLTLYHSPLPTSLSSSSSSSSSSSHQNPPHKPAPLAILAYLPHRPYLSKLLSFTPPPNVTDADELTQIITYLEGGREGSRYRSSSTSTVSFHPPHRGRFRLHVRDDGAVVGASWWSWTPPPIASAVSAGDGVEGGEEEEVWDRKNDGSGQRGEFDLVTQASAPVVVFDRPSKGGVGGGQKAGGAGGAGGKGGLNGEEGDEVVEEKSMFQK